MDWFKKREIFQFLGLTVTWPVLAYLAIFHSLDVDMYEGHSTSAVHLVISGLAAWVALKWRR